jgi:hypothetical protein
VVGSMKTLVERDVILRSVRRVVGGLVLTVIIGSGVVASSAASASTTSSDAALKHAALNYAKATLTGRFADLKAALSPECRSTDHVTARLLPLARTFWELQMGISFEKVRITGVRIQDLTRTSAQAEVEYNTSKAGNNNWVAFVLDKGHWMVGGACATPIGNTESSGSAPGSASEAEQNALRNLAKAKSEIDQGKG